MWAVAQLTDDFTKAILQYGPLGLFCLWLMWRETKATERHEKNEDRRDQRFDQLVNESRAARHSVDELVKMMSYEVLTRPNVVDRIVQESRDIHEAAKRRLSEKL